MSDSDPIGGSDTREQQHKDQQASWQDLLIILFQRLVNVSHDPASDRTSQISDYDERFGTGNVTGSSANPEKPQESDGS